MYTREEAKMLRETDPFDPRNIRDELKGKSNDEINDWMLETQTPLVIIAENLTGDFNVAQIVRTANAFNAWGVLICGNKRWDRRGAVGTQNYTSVDHFETAIEAIGSMKDRGYTTVAAEITNDAVNIAHYDWNEKTALVVGEEGRGLSQEALDLVDDVVYIPMLGTVRSLNVAGATQIMVYNYTQHCGFFD